jgi:peptidoglycan/xylan/chitin deacetylase (PgdA/CDA1 family)
MRAILTYHSIDDSGSVISMPLDVFREHVGWIARSHVEALTLDDLLARPASAPGDAVSITFDDGFANFSQAARLLREHRFPATVFAVSAHVGRTNAWRGAGDEGVPMQPLLGWDELARLAEHGVTIGAHTRTHPRLASVSDARMRDEMEGCLEEFERRLGLRPRHLAYPYGDVDDRSAAWAARSFAAAVTTEFRPLRDGDDPHRLPRLDMYYFRRSGAIEAWGRQGFGRQLAWIGARRRLRELLFRPAYS